MQCEQTLAATVAGLPNTTRHGSDHHRCRRLVKFQLPIVHLMTWAAYRYLLVRYFSALVILLFKSGSRLLSCSPLGDGKGSDPPKGPFVDESRSRCHNILASNFTSSRVSLCLLSERDFGSCRRGRSSAFACFIDSAPASSISLLLHSFMCSQLIQP